VNILEAIDVVQQSLTNQVYVEILDTIRDDVTKGNNLSDSMKKFPKYFAPFEIRVLSISERTGEVAQGLKNIAVYYESKLYSLLGGLSSALEPVLLIIMGGLVALMALSVITPIFQLLTGVDQITEVVLVVAIIAIISAIATDGLGRYYRTTVLSADVSKLVTEIRRTRQRAIANSTGSSYAIKFLTDRFVVFPGSGYNPSGSDNEDNFLDNAVIVSTTFTNDEIVFSNFNGRVNQAGDIELTMSSLGKTVTINSLGIVENVD
jgi:Tfp pilus assembly protein FimT